MNKLFVLSLLFITAAAQRVSAYADPAGKNLAIFIFGSAHTPEFNICFNDARTDLQRVLDANGFLPGQQRVFREMPKKAANGSPEFHSDRQTLLKKIPGIVQAGPYNDVFFFLAGHAEGEDEQALLSLPDKEGVRYAELLTQIEKIKAKRLVFVIAAPQGHVWIRHFSGPGRIVIAGSSKRGFHTLPLQFLKNFPRMFEKTARWHNAHPAAGKDQSVSLAEVLFLTGSRVRQWYQTNHLSADEEPVLEADGDGNAVAVGTAAWLQESVSADQVRFTIPWIRKPSPISRHRRSGGGEDFSRV